VSLANDAAESVFGDSIAYDECLNGIAYNKITNTFWMTGKNWPVMFEVQLYSRH